MQTNIKDWGNGQAVRLTKTILEEAAMSKNESIKVSVENGKIIIEKARLKKPHKTLQERFEGFTGEYHSEDIDWGNPVGKEIW